MERVIYGASVGRRRDIILVLHREGPMTLAKLRAALGTSASTLLFELSALERLGIVKREESLVSLTELGEKVASIIATAEPLKSLNFLSVIGLRPLVVWLLMSPLLPAAAIVLLTGWIFSIVIGSLQNPSLSMIYVLYVGYYLPLSINLPPQISMAVSLLSLSGIILAIYLITNKKMSLYKTAVGVSPLSIYPATHLTLVQLARSLDYVYLITLSQILLFVALLFTAAIFATVYSLEVGTTYEAALARSLLAFFVIPSLFYLAPLR